MNLYPNPVQDQLHVEFNLAKRGTITFHVIDASGRKIKTARQDGWFGSNNMSLNVSDLREGWYHLQLIHGGKAISTRFLKL
jgi:hypothetical protein